MKLTVNWSVGVRCFIFGMCTEGELCGCDTLGKFLIAEGTKYLREGRIGPPEIYLRVGWRLALRLRKCTQRLTF